MNKKTLNFVLLILVLLLSSCNSKNTREPILISGRQISVKIQKEECIFDKITPSKTAKQVFEFSGNSPKSDNIDLKSKTTLRIYWNQVSTKDYVLSITNISSDQANDPTNIIILESIIGPSSGCTDVTLAPGKYKVNVENANNDWKVLIDAITLK